MRLSYTRQMVSTVETTVLFPEWILLALNGEKINAIKAIREVAGPDQEARSLSLTQSKRIVEDFMNGISSTAVKETIINPETVDLATASLGDILSAAMRR